jgi:L-amino acid N-acyltransferase YncA
MIREATKNDFNEIWPIFKEVMSKGEAYAYPTEFTEDQAMQKWFEIPLKTFVFEKNGKILGTYYIRPNQQGGGSHVCNCGFMVSSAARGNGIATAMCEHSQKTALELGFKAMQFNFVISTNASAVRLWSKLGFKTVGSLPRAFNHPESGYVDALVMYKWLDRRDIDKE